MFGTAANCSNATFGDFAEFEDVALGFEAIFIGATFGGYASFVRAVFGPMAIFIGATLGSQADFRGATFGADARFWDTHFEGRLAFTGIFENQWIAGFAKKNGVEEQAAALVLEKRKNTLVSGGRFDRFANISFMCARFDGEAIVSGWCSKIPQILPTHAFITRPISTTQPMLPESISPALVSDLLTTTNESTGQRTALYRFNCTPFAKSRK